MTILQPLGSLFFSGAYKLQDDLPDPSQAERPVVVLRLRGHKRIGSTFLKVMETYAGKLRQRGGRLFISGVNDTILDQLEKTGVFEESIPRGDIFPATSVLGESTRRAMESAQRWLDAQAPNP